MKIRPAAALAASAVLVAMPRYLIAQRFADGQPAPAGPEWQTLVDLSAVAWAILEALTLAYIQTVYGKTKTPALRRWSLIVTGCIAVVSAPTIVAVSSGLSLTALLGIATPLHVLWATFLTASYALIVLAAFAADSADSMREVGALVDALDAQRQPQAVAAQQVTVNVGAATSPQPVRYRLADLPQLLIDKPGMSSTQYAELIGVSGQAVRAASVWRKRRQEVAE